MSLELTKELLENTNAYAHCHINEESILESRRILLIDGTTFTTMDTEENRKEWNNPSGQKEGCGFPTLGSLCAFSLNSNTIVNACFADCNSHDLRLVNEAFRTKVFQKDDIVVGDRAFNAYHFFQELFQKVRTQLLELKRIDSIKRML